MQNYRDRKLNRWKEYDYTLGGWYFITIRANAGNGIVVGNKNFCSPSFGEIIKGEMRLSTIGQAIQKCWQEIPIHFPNVQLDEFIIMPNHIHGIIIIENSVGNKNFCSENNHCSENNFGSGNNHCSVVADNNVNTGNKIFCSLQTQMPWQTKWARSLSSIVRGFKIGVIKWCNDNVRNDNYYSAPIWQKSYYDHVIRNENSLNKIREYIINNPLKWESDRNNTENLWI